jgi:hypothetical protein
MHRTQVRIGSDPEFASILNRIRLGQVDQVLLDSFNRETLRVEGIEQTRLYSKKASVDEENAEKLKILPGDSHIFQLVIAVKNGLLKQKSSPLGPTLLQNSP